MFSVNFSEDYFGISNGIRDTFNKEKPLDTTYSTADRILVIILSLSAVLNLNTEQEASI